MKIEEVLEKLEELFRTWNLGTDDWVVTGPYAFKLQGYKVKLREGHLNVLINKAKLWWKTHGMEAFPPKASREFKQFKEWMRATGFDSDLIPKSPKDMKRLRENSVLYPLPNGRVARFGTLTGQLREIGEFILPQCTEEGIGVEKGRYMLNAVKGFRNAAQLKGDSVAVKLADEIIRKYTFLEEEKEKLPKDYSKIKALKGNCASAGKVQGRVRVILDERKAGTLQKREILIVKMTSAKFTPLIDRARAIVTDDGGRLCHAAILSREFKIPCIVGTKIATKVLKDGDLVEVDAEKGVVRKLEK